ncbi:hypothetical protein [Sporanaerobacter acetigenes]|uniref:hypothetical protein n=1 Tax=Sporanaerobacter acetigenes TaxID=165813 RepID=UPI00135640B8|nr:hypothetical protein [Sporanaerobacter acetigenes]
MEEKEIKIPMWSNEIIKQLNWNGGLQLGFFNSLFAQKNVLQTTEGYNYLVIDDVL